MLDSSIIELDSIDSTNNYAMQLIDADKAQPGLTIVAQNQTGGKGQRGKTWVGIPGQSLLMSIITTPGRANSEQFAFNAQVATAIADVLRKLSDTWELRIKWPNDIIINDKKAGGVLIENVIRGSRWTHSVIGLGLNVKQEHFPPDLPNAISLKMALGHDVNMVQLRDDLREEIFNNTLYPLPAESSMKRYNEFLYKKGQKQRFSNSAGQWDATVLGVLADGSVQVQLEDGGIVSYYHGHIVWEWGVSK